MMQLVYFKNIGDEDIKQKKAKKNIKMNIN